MFLLMKIVKKCDLNLIFLWNWFLNFGLTYINASNINININYKLKFNNKDMNESSLNQENKQNQITYIKMILKSFYVAILIIFLKDRWSIYSKVSKYLR
jgi:hypothetical protein